MEGIQKIITACKKTHGSPSNMNRNNEVMNMFRYEHIKNNKIP